PGGDSRACSFPNVRTSGYLSLSFFLSLSLGWPDVPPIGGFGGIGATGTPTLGGMPIGGELPIGSGVGPPTFGGLPSGGSGAAPTLGVLPIGSVAPPACGGFA